jgi:hypothetical protein
MHIEELHNLYISPNVVHMVKSRMIIWLWHMACTAEMRNVYNVLVQIPAGKRPLGRFRCGWKDIRIYHRKIEWEDVDWIPLAQDRDPWQTLVNIIMTLQVP